MQSSAACRLEWTCCIDQLRKSRLASSWTMFGLMHLDDNGWHMHLISDRGCAYVDGKLMRRAMMPELSAGSVLRFTLDLEGRGVLQVCVDGGEAHVLSGSRGLVPGRRRAFQTIRRLFARAHIWDGSLGSSKKLQHADQNAGLDELRPQGVVRFLSHQ